MEHCPEWLRDLDTKKKGAEVFVKLQNMVLEENVESKVTNEEVLERIREKRTLLNNILRRKAKWIDHIPRRN